MSLGPSLAAVVLLAINAFFVAAEFALIAARRTYLEQRAGEGDRRAVWALASARDLSVMLAGAQLGVTVASVALGFVAEPAVAHLLEPVFHAVGLSEGMSHAVSFVVGLAIVVVAHMVLGEMVPKNLAIAGPEKSALLMAGPLRLYGRVFGPLLRALNGVANAVLRLLKVEPTDELATAATAEDLASMIGESRDEGFLDEFEEELLSGALHFDAATAAQVMVPRERIVAAPLSTTAEELEALVVRTGRSRIPLDVGDLERVVGFVHAKALLDVPPETRDKRLDRRLVRPILTVPSDRRLNLVLAAMRKQQIHIALVTEGGRTVGLLTLQDVLQTLVGQIREERRRRA
ncbi:MAG: hemolysin family protein [Acidimicrobiales bacterium]